MHYGGEGVCIPGSLTPLATPGDQTYLCSPLPLSPCVSPAFHLTYPVGTLPAPPSAASSSSPACLPISPPPPQVSNCGLRNGRWQPSTSPSPGFPACFVRAAVIDVCPLSSSRAQPPTPASRAQPRPGPRCCRPMCPPRARELL